MNQVIRQNFTSTTSGALTSIGAELNATVAALRISREVTNNLRFQGRVRELPSRAALAGIVEDIRAALFPSHFGHVDLTEETVDYFVGNTLDRALTGLIEQVRRGLSLQDGADGDLQERATDIVRRFAVQLPEIRALLFSDISAAYAGDPAATSASEILLCYPGITAISYYRLAHALHRLGSPMVARLVSDIAHSETAVDIHPGAVIGPGFFIDHGTGVVVGETAIIGSNVRLYQAVTLGAKRFPTDENGVLLKGGARHPILEDDVIIYAGATVLGRITIGKGSSIGGNVWLTHSVPPGSNITQAQARTERFGDGGGI